MLDNLLPEHMMLMAAAFVLGWLLAKLGSFLSHRARMKQRDPRDDRIRSLEAEQRIAVSDAAKAREDLETTKVDLTETQTFLADRDKAFTEQMDVIAQLKSDLKDSVRKTRELRAELQERATENVRSEVKLREVETELEVSRASVDLISTGVLDYSVAPDAENAEDSEREGDDLQSVQGA